MLSRVLARALSFVALLGLLGAAPARSAGPTFGAAPELQAEVRVRPCLSRFPAPAVRGETLDCVPTGTAVLRVRHREGWTLVKTPDGSVGWALDRFLAEIEPSRADAFRLASVRVRPCLVRRPSPNENGQNLDCLRYGTQVSRLREYGGWTLARTKGGEVGWVQSGHLTNLASGTMLEPEAAFGKPGLTSLPFVPGLKARGSLPSRPTPGAPRSAGLSVAPGSASSRTLYPAATVEAEPCLRRRARAAADAEVIDCLSSGAQVELIGRLETWAKVRSFEGVVGWVPNEHLAAGFGSPFLITDGDVGHVDAPDAPDSEQDADPGGETGSEQRGLEVDKWATSDEKPEGLMIVGMLRNLGSRINTAITLTVKVFDWEGRVVLEQPATVDTTILMPGQGSRFEATLPGIFAFRAVEFDTSSVDFEVTDSNLISTL